MAHLEGWAVVIAGNYPDVPAPRIAYDLDGTVIALLDTNGANPSQQTQGWAQTINNESTDNNGIGTGTGNNRYVVFIFPEPRDIVAYFVAFTTGTALGANLLDTSVDTTTGVDGTWVARGSYSAASTTVPNYRTAITTPGSPFTGIKAIRFKANQGSSFGLPLESIHLYGNPSTVMGTVDKLVFWHPTLDQPLGAAGLDFGNAPRSTADTKQFRVKNCSPSKTANSIGLSISVLTDTSPTVASQHTLSTDGSTFTATVNIGNLAPGAISSVVTLRRNLLSNAVLSIWALRIPAVPASWS